MQTVLSMTVIKKESCQSLTAFFIIFCYIFYFAAKRFATSLQLTTLQKAVM